MFAVFCPPLREVLLLVVCGTIAYCDDYNAIADWGETHLDFLRQHLLPPAFALRRSHIWIAWASLL
jgi:hypothetical protein